MLLLAIASRTGEGHAHDHLPGPMAKSSFRGRLDDPASSCAAPHGSVRHGMTGLLTSPSRRRFPMATGRDRTYACSTHHKFIQIADETANDQYKSVPMPDENARPKPTTNAPPSVKGPANVTSRSFSGATRRPRTATSVPITVAPKSKTPGS